MEDTGVVPFGRYRLIDYRAAAAWASPAPTLASSAVNVGSTTVHGAWLINSFNPT